MDFQRNESGSLGFCCALDHVHISEILFPPRKYYENRTNFGVGLCTSTRVGYRLLRRWSLFRRKIEHERANKHAPLRPSCHGHDKETDPALLYQHPSKQPC